MDLAIVMPWVTSALSIIALGTALKNIIGSPTKELAKKVEDHATRLQHVENELQHLPDKDAVNELKIAIAELKGTVGGLTDKIGAVGKTVDRIDTYLSRKSS